MAGIKSYGAYVPLWRMSRETIAKQWGMAPAPGEKAVASYDEDSITMAVAAAMDCLHGLDREQVDGLLFASTNSPYKEKQAATTVAAAIDLKSSLFTGDYTNSLRAGTSALRAALDAVKAGSAKEMLVAAGDCRLGAPRSDYEQTVGDGAVALLVSNTDVIAEVEVSHSTIHEIVDMWRSDKEDFVGGWEDRFVFQEGFLRSMTETIAGCLAKGGLKISDITKAALYAPDARRHAELVRALRLDAKSQVQDPLLNVLGNTGAAFAPMLLVAALEQAKAGDRILLASYGDGCDAYVLRVTQNITKLGSRRGIKAHVQSKRLIPDYSTYMRWRGLMQADAGSRRPPIPIPSASALWRERNEVLRLYGATCQSCGTTQYPPQRMCTICHTPDKSTPVRLSDKKGSIFTYSMDYIAGSVEVPLVVAIVDFEGGGRMVSQMTDRDINEIKVGMPVEMSFRNLYTVGGIHNYFWKSTPVRA